jgi:hypothetical protein
MRLGVIVCVAALAASACSKGDEFSRRQFPLDAYCTANVIGTGNVDVETDYIPNVINCENGAASLEALKAQAVAARSYLYYRLDRTGDIADGTNDQVYSCNRTPSAAAVAAAEATSGQVLQYQGTQVAAFYVAGSLQDPPECRGGMNDPTNTERFVTYNQGKSGDEIEQTTLGFVDPSNLANRGCKSQNGADCLSDDGWAYGDILRFYYGEDIELVTAEGACVVSSVDAGGTTDDSDAGGTGNNNGEVSGGCVASDGASGPGAAMLALVCLLLARRRRARAV